MSKNEGTEDETFSNSQNIPSNEDIINEVVDSCKNLKVDKEGSNEEESVDDKESEVKDEDYIDDAYLQSTDSTSTPEELEKRKTLAIEGKNLGNTLFKNEEYEEARQKYTESLRTCPLEFKEERAILFANRGAAKMKQNLKVQAIEDCTRALELNPKYVKAFIRRAKLYEETDKLDEALEDYKKILELDPGNSEARGATMRLPGEINERNERLKAEMLGSLKELGNKLLKPFGLSTDNFQLQKDPNSGGYSINFTQNKK